jgi:site-specific recombinase XerD
MTTPASFAPLLERFFTQRLMQQRQASPHTISSYRDTFRQFVKFVQQRLHKPPSRLRFEEINAPLIVAFLDDLEKHQGLSIRSRNLRLTAIHSFFRYAAFEAPAHSAQIQRVLAIPASASRGTWSAFSPVPKSMPCWPLRISAPGLAGAITRSCWWQCRRGYAYRK